MDNAASRLYRQRRTTRRRGKRARLTYTIALCSLLKPENYKRNGQIFPRESHRVSHLVKARLATLVNENCINFVSRIGMPYCVFITRVFKLMQKVYPSIAPKRYRYHLPLLHRVYRMMRFMRDDSLNALTDLFDQHRCTVQRDVQKLVRLFATKVAPTYIQYPSIHSAEYRLMRGAGDFHAIPHCVYAADVMSVEIGKPEILDADIHYDFKHHQYSQQVTFIVDGGEGLCRVMIGPTSGNANDRTMVNASKFLKNVEQLCVWVLCVVSCVYVCVCVSL